MSRKIDLSDPAFEPTDEELQELSKRAFAGVGERHALALRKVEDEMEERRKEVLVRVEEALARQP